MSENAIIVENISKLYRLGQVGTGALAQDINRSWHRLLGRRDPYEKIGETNDRTSTGRKADYIWALQGVSFEVRKGEVLGIIGRNGAGKSTLLKILSRVTTQTEGRIKVRGRIASLLEVGTGFHPELTGRENIFLNGAILGMRKAEIARKFDEIVEFSGCARYIDTPVKRYSSGMYVRLAFAVAAHLEPEILIVDEVLAVGDAEFQKKCLGKMKDVSGEGRTVLFVSHNIYAMRNLCNQGVLLNKGEVETTGNINTVVDQYLQETGPTPSTAILDTKNADSQIGFASKVSIHDMHGNDNNKIHLGNPWIIKILITIKRPLEAFIASVALKTIDGHTCRVSWSNPCYLDVGNYEVNVTEKNISLSKGIYNLVIGISNNKNSFHYIDGCLKLEIIESGKELIQYNISGSIINGMQTVINKLSNEDNLHPQD